VSSLGYFLPCKSKLLNIVEFCGVLWGKLNTIKFCENTTWTSAWEDICRDHTWWSCLCGTEGKQFFHDWLNGPSQVSYLSPDELLILQSHIISITAGTWGGVIGKNVKGILCWKVLFIFGSMFFTLRHSVLIRRSA
jgi:hypothetical protein